MKHIYILILAVCFVFTSGCSSSDSGSAKANNDPELGEALESYQTFLGNTLNDSTSLLDRYNALVDSLYVQDVSADQLANSLKEIIKDSSELVKHVDGHDYYHQNIQPYHRSLIGYINEQHQLFLDSIEMANNDRVDKGELRENYLIVKESQNNIINSWGTAAEPAEQQGKPF
ncbi:hypothetical protein [Bacillus sp. RO1]|uniref:hypothetical protein n=1 Tax=Bacillus sp. RO1 TaxID=2722703 RepID=UPI001457528D|nr:hypothetical protein [Bacillus sp. RO1]NLP52196.1 hypothetical protein [Bacillus sp. RO1]